MKRYGFISILAFGMALSLSCTLSQAIATPTNTPIPGGTITGRIYLMDRDEPIQTEVQLVERNGGSEIVDSTRSNEGGYYTFSITESGDYAIHVSVTDLLDMCDNLRTLSGWPVVVRSYDTSGVVKVYAGNMPFSVTLEDVIHKDCELYCD